MITSIISSTQKTTVQKYNIILTAGQSNAEGRLQTSHASTPNYLQNGLIPAVKVWTGSNIVNYDLSEKGPSGNGMEWVASTGLTRWGSLHVALKEIADVVPNLLVCNVSSGGSILAPVERDSLAQNGSWSEKFSEIPSSQAKLLQALENRLQTLRNYCKVREIEIDIKALLWHQGEADGADADGADADYEGNWADFVTYLRGFAGNDLPIIYGTIPATSSKYSLLVRDAQLDFASSDANAWCRDNNDLDFFDGLHFDGPSCEVFGGWAADTFLGI